MPAVSRGFMQEFIDVDPPRSVLGPVEVGGIHCAMIALRRNRPSPARHKGGFRFSQPLCFHKQLAIKPDNRYTG